MRLQPIICNTNAGKKNAVTAPLFVRKTNSSHRGCHRYTGNISADLAYASMIDKTIARDLKLMGLI